MTMIADLPRRHIIAASAGLGVETARLRMRDADLRVTKKLTTKMKTKMAMTMKTKTVARSANGCVKCIVAILHIVGIEIELIEEGTDSAPDEVRDFIIARWHTRGCIIIDLFGVDEEGGRIARCVKVGEGDDLSTAVRRIEESSPIVCLDAVENVPAVVRRGVTRSIIIQDWPNVGGEWKEGEQDIARLLRRCITG